MVLQALKCFFLRCVYVLPVGMFQKMCLIGFLGVLGACSIVLGFLLFCFAVGVLSFSYKFKG